MESRAVDESTSQGLGVVTGDLHLTDLHWTDITALLTFFGAVILLFVRLLLDAGRGLQIGKTSLELQEELKQSIAAVKESVDATQSMVHNLAGRVIRLEALHGIWPESDAGPQEKR